MVSVHVAGLDKGFINLLDRSSCNEVIILNYITIIIQSYVLQYILLS